MCLKVGEKFQCRLQYGADSVLHKISDIDMINTTGEHHRGVVVCVLIIPELLKAQAGGFLPGWDQPGLYGEHIRLRQCLKRSEY